MGEVLASPKRADGAASSAGLALKSADARRAGEAGLVQRFERERDILACPSTPRSARLYDAGFAADANPISRSIYVEGQPIDTWCRERALPIASG